MSAIASDAVEGHVSSGCEAVREAFEDNVARRDELGGTALAGGPRDVALREALTAAVEVP